MSPNIIFFIVFLLASFLYGLNSFFILYHLIRFGIGTRPKQAAFIFFTGSLILFIFLTVGFFNINVDKIIKQNSVPSIINPH